jgi:alkylhydroperoxidase family enzyme
MTEPRIAPAEPPYPESVQTALDRLTRPGIPPLTLFTTLARDERLFTRFMRGSLLDEGNLTVRQRELVIDRTTARCGNEYEWGVHVKLFAKSAGFSEEQISATVWMPADAACWTDEDRAILRACDQLQDTAHIDDATWSELSAYLSAEAILEVLMLAGFYRTVSYVANGVRLEPEAFATRFPHER